MVEIHARRWSGDMYGNTYHSVQVALDDVWVAYGYGSAYRQTALEILADAGINCKDERGHWKSLNRVIEETGAELLEDVRDVKRKKDLHGAGKMAAQYRSERRT